MANQTRAELEAANQALISVDPDTGELIVSKDHRDMNDLMIDFGMSYTPIEAYVGNDGKVTDTRFYQRKLALVIANNSPIQSSSFIKAYSDIVLEFTDMILSPGTLVTIFFLRSS